MVINPEKIRAVIEYYGNIKGYPQKSQLKMFTEENGLNYKQWAAHVNGSQPAGSKVVDVFMDIFPNIDMNWLVKDEVPASSDMFNLKINKEIIVSEPEEKYKREITNEQIFVKLEEIHFELKNQK